MINPCQNCKEREATESWAGEYSLTETIRSPSLLQRWCTVCTLRASIAYRKSLIPIEELERQLEEELNK